MIIVHVASYNFKYYFDIHIIRWYKGCDVLICAKNFIFLIIFKLWSFKSNHFNFFLLLHSNTTSFSIYHIFYYWHFFFWTFFKMKFAIQSLLLQQKIPWAADKHFYLHSTIFRINHSCIYCLLVALLWKVQKIFWYRKDLCVCV